jgi:hypothetical protein
MSQYEENRARFSFAELQRYEGQWVAFSSDGSRIVGSAATLAVLEEQLLAQGEDARSLAFEHLEFEDSSVGGADLFMLR